MDAAPIVKNQVINAAKMGYTSAKEIITGWK